MLTRHAREEVVRRLAASPAVALIGPRQCGKTTLARTLGGAYFDLEQPSERLRADLEWEQLSSSRGLVIFDEAQSWPEVFPRLRGTIDQDRRRRGRFLLLGSVAPSLMVRISQSLAGRLSTVELTPILWTELKTTAERERRWLCGGFPDGGVLEKAQYPRWQRDYLSQLVQRDLPNWGLPSKPQTTDRLIRMLAAVHGQVWNASQIGQSLGLSFHTVNSYVDFLVGAFLVQKLPPYQANIRKRLVRSPRLYWRDTGLLHAVLDIPDVRALLAQPWVGASWEGFVIEQVLGELSSRGRNYGAYYFRTADQHEVDLVIDTGRERWAIEVKLTSSPTEADVERLNRAADLIKATRRFLVTRTARPSGNAHVASCDLASLIDYLRQASA